MEKNIAYHWVFRAAVLFLFFFWIGQIPLGSSDEGRFGEIAREMWVSKDFIVPHFNYIPHIEKPIFSFWLASLSIGVFGIGSFSVRLPSVLSAILGIVLTRYFTSKLFSQKTADLATIILTTSVGYVLVGRYAMIDMLMTLLMSSAIFCLALASIKQKSQFYYLAYFFMGFSFITKGLIGIVLPALIFLAFLVWTRNLGEIKKMRLGWGILIIALIFIPWGIAISMREPEFSYTFIVKQHFHRYSTAFFGRKRPVWFFAPILISLAFPWSFFLPAAIFRGNQPMDQNKKRSLQFLICWLAVIFVFFSVPKSKLPYYILPLCVPLAVLVAAWLQEASDAEKSNQALTKVFCRTLQMVGIISILGLIGANFYLAFWVKDPRILAVRGLIQIASLCAVIGGTLAGIFLKRKNYRRNLLAMASTVYVLLIIAVIGMKSLTPYLSTYDYAKTLKSVMKQGDQVAVFASPDHFSDLPFHLQQRIIVAGSDHGTLTEELEEPQHAEDVRNWFPTADQFIHRFNSGRARMFCLTEAKNLKELNHLGLVSYKIIQQGGGKLLISNEI